MPDAHVGMGATVGSVIPTRDAVTPSAVGVDIGCGMVAAELDVTADQLPDSRDPLLDRIAARVPAGVGRGHDTAAHKADRWMGKNRPHTRAATRSWTTRPTWSRSATPCARSSATRAPDPATRGDRGASESAAERWLRASPVTCRTLGSRCTTQVRWRPTPGRTRKDRDLGYWHREVLQR